MTDDRHIGQILLSDELIMTMLHFEGGTVHYLTYDPKQRAFAVGIEHPDMPICPENVSPSTVTPNYRTIVDRAATYERHECPDEGECDDCDLGGLEDQSW